MKPYLDVLRCVLENGRTKKGPQASGTIALCGMQMRFDLSENFFPLITTRNLKGSWKAAISELLWILSGSTNALELQKKYEVHLWDQWIDPTYKLHRELGFELPKGELGPIYGHQMRNFGATQRKDGTFQNNGRDQLQAVIESIKRDSGYRRHIITLYNPLDFNAPDGSELVFICTCHGTLIHFFCPQNDVLSMHHVQRSADLPVGVPFNIVEYALLLLMVCKVTGKKPGELIHTLSDAHIYENQKEGVEELLRREPKSLPRVTIPDITDLSIETVKQLGFEDFVLRDYNPHPSIKFPVEV